MRTRRERWYAAPLLALGFVLVIDGAAPDPTVAQGAGSMLSTWIQLGPNSAAIARAVTDGATCPSITLNGTVTAMAERGSSALPAWPVRVCELPIPPGTTTAILGQPEH
jgi:hypothetical protein